MDAVEVVGGPVELRSLRGLGGTVMALVGTSTVVWVSQLSADVAWVRLWDRLEVARAEVGMPYPSGSEAERIAGEIDILWYARSGIATLQLGVFSLAFLVFLLWLARAWRNLSVLVDLGSSSASAVGLWFVPFLNVAMPPMIVSRLLRGSRAARRGSRDWKQEPVSPLVPLWWGAYLVGVAGSLSGDLVSDWAAVVADACFVVAGAALIAVVAQVGSAQGRIGLQPQLADPPVPPGPLPAPT